MLLEDDEQACLPLVAGQLVSGSIRGVQASTKGASPDAALDVGPWPSHASLRYKPAALFL